MTDTSSQSDPSADEVQERINQLHDSTDSGEGNNEPDPATSDNPPNPSQQGDREREQH